MFLNLFQPDLAETLGWTLLHSLWQGTLIFVLIHPLLVLFKKRTPRLRYNLLCLALMLLVGSMAVTFYLYMPDLRADTVWEEITTASEQEAVTAALPSPGHNPVIYAQDFTLSVRESVRHFIQLYSGYLVNIWLLGACFFAFRWLGGLTFTFRLKTSGTRITDPQWQEKVQTWRREMGIRRPVQILESLRTEVPLILGHLKPLILLPLGTINSLAPEQVEAIVLHELAHIRRYDFMINLIIAALEMVLFYHPVYWWLSDQIQQEREQCCDDIAVAVCGNTRLYAETLLLMEEKRQQNTLAMAYQGKKNHLLERIKRICLASPASYRPEYGKAGLSLALLLAVAAVSWAKLPEKVNLTPVSSFFEAPMEMIESIKPKPVESFENTPPLPELPQIQQELPADLPPQTQTAAAPTADTIPYKPNIPAMGIEPTLPTAPDFPYTTESLAKALQEKQNDPDFLANTIESYEDQLRDWQNQVRTGYLSQWQDRKNLIIDTYQAWKNDMGQYRRQDHIAFLVAMKNGIRYFEDELKLHENAVKKAENAVKAELENYIKAFENMIKVHEDQQADHEQRMAVHEDRMRVHNLRMAAHDGRMNIHDNRMSIHDTRMMFHDERMKIHDELMQAFEKEFFASLEADGLARKSDNKLNFVLEDGKITVNGKVLNATLTQKYTELLKKYGFSPPTDGSFFFKIDENNRSIGTSGTYSRTRKED